MGVNPNIEPLLAHAPLPFTLSLDGGRGAILTLAARETRLSLKAMSRAFVKEDDDAVEDLPERPVSSAPNLVTAEGLAAIEAEVAQLTAALAQTKADDRATRARIGRDLRYWTARRGSAQLTPPPDDNEIVRFGSRVSIERDDGRRQTFRIVGEDEADPERGTLSYVSPLARALMGRSVGDSVRVAGADAEILDIG